MRKFFGAFILLVAIITLFRMPSAGIYGGAGAVGYIIVVGIIAALGCYLLFGGNKKGKDTNK